MTFRSPIANAGCTLILGLCALSGCTSTADWSQREGRLELFASPLPPVAGESFWIGVRAQNVGPVDVLQDDQRIASFVGVDLTEGVTRVAVAAGGEPPRASAVAFDYRRLEVDALPFEPPTGQQPGPSDDLVERCDGAIDEPAPRCVHASGSPYTVRFQNFRDRTVSVVQMIPHAIEPNQCIPVTVALPPPGTIRQAEITGGTVLGMIEDGSATPMRIITLPEEPPEDGICDFRIEP